jgi:hypothetical protein
MPLAVEKLISQFLDLEAGVDNEDPEDLDHEDSDLGMHR